MNQKIHVIEATKKQLDYLGVARAEDLPYWSSPPIQFVYESTASVAVGKYTWADNPSALIVSRPVMANTLYYFRNISFIADIVEGDYTANIATIPTFQFFVDSDLQVPKFREPLYINKFYDQFEYRLFWIIPSQLDNATIGQILCAFRGELNQGVNLVGKNQITLKAVISAQEITDDNFIAQFKKNYPLPTNNGDF